ncbi:MAG: hypothetical protein FRX48_07452 [Lasallia pustulata]|uniref:Uncharacterized protein n=1 Tax=Lasallia pustulata TaxID=136370 RepID=A0A5M8PJF5_9LECA|nr:MAG: hypothetical protein FRX48_07452 [Lasallia pustulata]
MPPPKPSATKSFVVKAYLQTSRSLQRERNQPSTPLVLPLLTAPPQLPITTPLPTFLTRTTPAPTLLNSIQPPHVFHHHPTLRQHHHPSQKRARPPNHPPQS